MTIETSESDCPMLKRDVEIESEYRLLVDSDGRLQKVLLPCEPFGVL